LVEVIVKSLLAYLLGSLVGALVVGRLRGGVDIRELGSGNAGGTNALHTQGAFFALWVMLIDIGKGTLAAGYLPKAPLFGGLSDPTMDTEWLAVACSAAVVLGHVYPLWSGFRGGKGAATLLGVFAGLEPQLLIPSLLVWLIVVALSGYVGLGTIMAVAVAPLYFAVTQGLGFTAMMCFGVAMLTLICFTHRSNIVRMVNGTESRARRLWLLRPK
jgi:glycerol-3-phosphate acyltransferase PlsY